MVVVVWGDGEGVTYGGRGRGRADTGDRRVSHGGVAAGRVRAGVDAGSGGAFSCEGGFSDFRLLALDIDIT